MQASIAGPSGPLLLAQVVDRSRKPEVVEGGGTDAANHSPAVLQPPRELLHDIVDRGTLRKNRGNHRNEACDPQRPIVKHLANHPRPDSCTR